jgi:hypothetical protein
VVKDLSLDVSEPGLNLDTCCVIHRDVPSFQRDARSPFCTFYVDSPPCLLNVAHVLQRIAGMHRTAWSRAGRVGGSVLVNVQVTG